MTRARSNSFSESSCKKKGGVPSFFSFVGSSATVFRILHTALRRSVRLRSKSDCARGAHEAFAVTIPPEPGATNQTPWQKPGRRRSLRGLKQIPQELVVDLVMELHFWRFDNSSQRAGATVGGIFLQLG